MQDITKKRIYNIISYTFLFIMFVIMCMNASRQSFWIDELDYCVEFISRSSLFDMINGLLKTVYNLPLYYLVMFPIYKIAPYGEFWILLPNIIITLISTIIMKKIGEKIGGEDYGFVAMCLTISSYILIYNGAFELRPYAFLFFFSALTFYRYICKIKDNNKKNNILFVISMILLAYTHWFGCLSVVFYFIIDTYFCIKKRIPISYILQYFIVGFTFLPWFVFTLLMHTSNISQYWANIPNLGSVIEMIQFLLSDNKICFLLFIIGLIFFLLLKILKIKKKYDNYIKFCICGIVFATSTIFIYSRFINNQGSLFVNRYFFCILPYVLIITALPLYELLNLKISFENKPKELSNKDIKISKILTIIIVVILFIIITCQNYYNLYRECKSYLNPYREISDVLISSPEIYDENCAVITSQGKAYLNYYFEKRGKRIPLNAYTQVFGLRQVVKNGEKVEIKKLENEELLNYNVLYLCNVSAWFDRDFLEFIEENYTMREKIKGLGIFIYEKDV